MSSLFESLVELPAPSETVFWSGAGISIDAPTCLPSGVDLTRWSLDALFASGTRETIETLYGDFDRQSTVPRLETVLGVASADDVHGLTALELLTPIRTAPPNRLHGCLAAHLLAGGAQITMNFDRCIERATCSPEAAERLLHLHGVIDDLESVRRGASVALLDRGFDADTSQSLMEICSSARLLIFVGYSGSDFFDVDPFLQSWAAEGHARGRTVLWIHHRQPGQGLFAAVGGQTTRRQLAVLSAGNAQVIEIAMPTAEALTSTVEQWGLPLTDEEPDASTTSDRQVLQPVIAGRRAQRSLATLRLYHHLGASDRTEDALAVVDVPPRTHHEISAEIAWGRGQYRVARNHWKAAWTYSDAATQLRRRERVAATHWVQGRLGYAAWLLIRAIRAARAAGVDPAPAAETLVYVSRHSRRTPEWSWFPHHRLERWARQYVPEPTKRQGTHLDTRYATLRRDSEDTPIAERVAAHVAAAESFQEYEALNGVLNFEHGRLRRIYESGDRPRAEEYVRLRRWAYALGRTESAIRVLFLPGADSAFSLPTVLWAAATRLQVTPWQRVRFAGVAVVGWLRRRRSGGSRHPE